MQTQRALVKAPQTKLSYALIYNIGLQHGRREARNTTTHPITVSHKSTYRQALFLLAITDSG